MSEQQATYSGQHVIVTETAVHWLSQCCNRPAEMINTAPSSSSLFIYYWNHRATKCNILLQECRYFSFFVWIKNVLTYHYEWSTVVQQNRHALQILFSRCKGACLFSADFSVVGYLILKRREAGCCVLLFCHVHCEGILLCQAMEV